MATVGIIISDKISPALLKAAGPETLRKALMAGATVLARDTRLSWKEAGRRPTSWAPNAPATIESKGGSTPLVDTGHLRDGIALGEVTSKEATVGTDVVYAAYNQFGTKRGIPARQFVPVSESGELTDQAEREIVAAMETAMRSAVGE